MEGKRGEVVYISKLTLGCIECDGHAAGFDVADFGRVGNVGELDVGGEAVTDFDGGHDYGIGELMKVSLFLVGWRRRWRMMMMMW